LRIDKLAVVGVGLIGGSCALALKRAGAVGTVVGIGRTAANLDDALRLGIIDRALRLDQAWSGELHDTDVVLVAAPVAQYPALFAAIVPVRRAYPTSVPFVVPFISTISGRSEPGETLTDGRHVNRLASTPPENHGILSGAVSKVEASTAASQAPWYE